jgi:alkylhydroperoxidase family enzyme
MSEFQIHSVESAPEASRPFVQAAQQRFGMVPNLIGVLADAPIAVEAYLQLSELAGRSSFSPTERTAVWFEINRFHDCHYCSAAHTAIAHGERIDPEVIAAGRAGDPFADPRLEALRTFTRTVLDRRGWVPTPELEAFLAAGFVRAQVLEVVTLVAQKTISNYVNHIAATPVDAPFERFA